MKYARIFFLSLLFGFSGLASADDAARVEAGKLLDSMNMQATLDQAISTTLDAQLAQKPELAPYKHVMLAFFAKYMSYAALKQDMVTIYASEFSASELREIRDFYSTPTGKKAVQKIPSLISKGAEMGAKSVQDHIPELLQVIQQESERIQKLQATEVPPASP